jgi:DnaK suppressor protein
VTPNELDEFKEMLDLERQRVESAIASLHENGTRSLEDESGDPGGVGADTASITFDRELEEGLQESALQTLAQINRALERLADGSYGSCERCGKPIGSERLHVRPWAILCIEDQRLADRG